MRKILVLMVMMLALFSPADGAFLEEGSTGGRTVIETPVMPPVPPDSCGARDAVADFLSGAELGAVSRKMDLSVFPITASHWDYRSEIRSLDDAVSHGDLRIRESGEGRVPWISVKNDGDRPVLMMAGEILTGGKQNRIVALDYLLPPDSGWVDLSVFCGERNRWSHTFGGGFGSAKTLAPGPILEKIARGDTQSGIWSGVKESLEESGAANKTEDLSAVYESGKKAEALKCFHRGRWLDFPKNTVGMVVVGGHRVLGIDVAPNPRVFRDNSRKVIDSIISSYPTVRSGCFEEMKSYPYFHDQRSIAESALRALSTASFHGSQPAGLGCACRMNIIGSNGTTLTRGGTLVHLSLIGSSPVIYKE